ncbi:MAG: preprotein translocase subunit SecE [candidate division NC10 bacterium]
MREWVRKAIRFFREVRAELGKVSWPGRKEVIGSTVVVIISVFIVSFFLGLVDAIIQKVMSAVLR